MIKAYIIAIFNFRVNLNQSQLLLIMSKPTQDDVVWYNLGSFQAYLNLHAEGIK
jgi:hypothetical protein